MKSETLVPFSKPQGKNNFNTLSISVYHNKAGYNYFSGNHYEAGHRLSFGPCTITKTADGHSIRTSVMMSGDQWESGFFLMLDNASRKNPHYVKRLMDALETQKASLTVAYEAKDTATMKEITAKLNEIATKSPAKPAKTTAEAMPERKSLLTKAILDQFAKVGTQENSADPVIVAKFFNSMGAGTWYASEYNEAEKVFYGFVSIFGDMNDEWGNFSLAELESIPTIERDRFFTSKPFSQINL